VSVVVDASLVVAVVLDDAYQDAARDHLAGWLSAGERLHAPAVLTYELANVLARRVFDGSLEIGEVTPIWHDVAALGLELHAFDMARDGPAVAATTARLRRRHATDSSYVWLASRLGAEMWTLDGGLARNATDLGLPVRLVS
jgi:predicted nucleic acid-binding protein